MADYYLGIDTSNYTTSVAIVDQDKKIIKDLRKILEVKQGSKGLRQSDALFQHIKNVPQLVEQAIDSDDIRQNIRSVAVSTRPRAVAKSYMPVFLAGVNCAMTLSTALGVPGYEFSHQEGHMEAVRSFSPLDGNDTFLVWHISGGTTELLKWEKGRGTIIGGSKDISMGQVIDRCGVSLGFDFPCGAAMDKLVADDRDLAVDTSQNGSKNNRLTTIAVRNSRFNLSGIDTQCSRVIHHREGEIDEAEKKKIISDLMLRLAQCIRVATEQAVAKTRISNVMFIGGVSSSRYIGDFVRETLGAWGIKTFYSDKGLSSDNGVGIALLGKEAFEKRHK